MQVKFMFTKIKLLQIMARCCSRCVTDTEVLKHYCLRGEITRNTNHQHPEECHNDATCTYAMLYIRTYEKDTYLLEYTGDNWPPYKI